MDGNDNIIFLDEKYIRNDGFWYYFFFIDVLYLDEIVFINYENLVYFLKGVEVKIWFGEDLKNWNNFDNSGRVCVDVYVYF